MSELAKMLTTVTTGRRFAQVPALSSVMEVKDKFIEHGVSQEYQLEARFVTLMVLRTPDMLTHATSISRRRVIEHVFGEFRQPLLDLQVAMYQKDFEDANRLANKIFNQMFEEGL